MKRTTVAIRPRGAFARVILVSIAVEVLVFALIAGAMWHAFFRGMQ